MAVLDIGMATKEVSSKTVVKETKGIAERHGPQFIPKLRGKKVIIRLISGGQPVTGTIEGYNPQEILIQTAKGQLLSLSTLLLLSKSWMSQTDIRLLFRS